MRSRGKSIEDYEREWLLAKPGTKEATLARKRLISARRTRRDPDALRSLNLKRNYGIDLDDYRRMLEAQGHRCGICGVHESDTARSVGMLRTVRAVLNVDHCHETNRVRGLLCRQCNTALGVLGDNIEGLEKALAYLRRTR